MLMSSVLTAKVLKKSTFMNDHESWNDTVILDLDIVNVLIVKDWSDQLSFLSALRSVSGFFNQSVIDVVLDQTIMVITTE